tara:strand:+ start:81 stop:614 length:534 start_codon:yes stop_codon:yes gene_type:complete
MAQEFVINSAAIESKINQLLPSQGGSGAGIDFSASTMVIPIVDLTESAEGSALRSDLQSAFSYDVSSFRVTNATTTVISTTGFFKCIASAGTMNAGSSPNQRIDIFDGTTAKILIDFGIIPNISGVSNGIIEQFVVCIGTGESLRVTSDQANSPILFSSRQIADISGNLVNPTALQI